MNYTSRRNTNNNKVIKTFKDYLVPIVIVAIVLLLIINNLFSGNDTNTNTSGNYSVEVSMGDPNTEAYVILNGGNKNKLEAKTSMYAGEKLQVVNGSLNVTGSGVNFSLNKLGELRYNEGGNYTLFSSDLWVSSTTKNSIEMRYAKINANAGSVFSLSQNEVASTIYVLAGVVEVQNLAGKTASLQKGEKLVIMRNNANDETSDLSLSKEQIDDYIKTDDWFIKNNGQALLSIVSTNTSTGSMVGTGMSNSGEILTGSLNIQQNTQNASYISFNNLYDEMEVDSSSIDVNGALLSDMVAKIEVDSKEAKIDVQTKTFSVKAIKLESRSNDLVYRVYDEGNKLLYKGVITVYTTNFTSQATITTDKKSSLAQVENYPISTSPYYQILAPKQNPYTTSDDIVRLEGTVPTKTVEKIIVNDFELKKFPKYGSYWSYFANSDFGNLKDGVNIYKIQYFGAEGKLLYENNFTIIKEPKQIETISTGSAVNTSSTGITQ